DTEPSPASLAGRVRGVGSPTGPAAYREPVRVRAGDREPAAADRAPLRDLRRGRLLVAGARAEPTGPGCEGPCRRAALFAGRVLGRLPVGAYAGLRAEPGGAVSQS